MKRLDMIKKFLVLAIAVVAFGVPANNRLWERINAINASKNQQTLQPTIDPALLDLAKRYEAWVHRAIAAEKVPGAAIAIIKDSTIVLLKGFGVKKAGTTDSVGLHTVFRLASLSKGFAPVLAAQFVEDGCLHWDDKIASYIPYLNLRNKQHTENISLRHVLSHTTGLPRHTFSNLLNSGQFYEEIFPRLKEVKITHPLGVYYAYQNVTYSFVGDVVHTATGKSYARLLGERIFTPAGMDDASATYDGMLSSPDVAQPHNILRDGSHQPIEISPNYYEVIPAAGVNASISDMVCWMQVLMGNRPDIISQQRLQEIFTPQVEVNLKEMRKWPGLQRAWYALGWRILDFEDKMLVYHGGFVNGYRTEIAFDPRDKIGIVVLSNGISHFIGNSVMQFFAMYNKTEDQLQDMEAWTD
ncbi:MAG TPA: serine hydrolase domain-containing protein [Saprospiraceae bacterium]|nr:serine hydrolase domain-containing protein [Saprospiraceae bacterium]HMP24981.1 serine hydrolase domain-containing protein [Saprospiraceae bacterium]